MLTSSAERGRDAFLALAEAMPVDLGRRRPPSAVACGAAFPELGFATGSTSPPLGSSITTGAP